jgi:hypothetical protein
MATVKNSTVSRFHNLGNEALADARGRADAIAAAMATSAAGGDAEIVALAAEVLRRCDLAAAFSAARIEPSERFEHLIHDDWDTWEERSAERFAYSPEVCREAAIDELGDMEEKTDLVFYRMMAIQATTQPGRAAKVRALLVHVMRDEWRGPAGPLDWEKEHVRALLGEFAGLSADELAAI